MNQTIIVVLVLGVVGVTSAQAGSRNYQPELSSLTEDVKYFSASQSMERVLFMMASERKLGRESSPSLTRLRTTYEQLGEVKTEAICADSSGKEACVSAGRDLHRKILERVYAISKPTEFKAYISTRLKNVETNAARLKRALEAAPNGERPPHVEVIFTRAPDQSLEPRLSWIPIPATSAPVVQAAEPAQFPPARSPPRSSTDPLFTRRGLGTLGGCNARKALGNPARRSRRRPTSWRSTHGRTRCFLGSITIRT